VELPPLSPALKQPIVCYVTDRKAFDPADSLARVSDAIRMAFAAGVDWVQIRERDLPGRALLKIVRNATEAAAQEQGRVLVNDRLDVALAGGAGGVHLARQSAPVREVIAWCRNGNAPAEFSIGVSCHSLEEAREAERDGASYVFFGPVFETPSKKSFGKAQGIANLAEACGAVRIPVLAIGGVNAENAAQCIQAGAAGIAAIRMFQEVSDAVALHKAVERLHRCK
jgi:thiamine-phosphate pyrophosphorylase